MANHPQRSRENPLVAARRRYDGAYKGLQNISMLCGALAFLVPIALLIIIADTDDPKEQAMLVAVLIAAPLYWAAMHFLINAFRDMAINSWVIAEQAVGLSSRPA